MPGVLYIGCTPVTRAIIRSHLRNHPEIPVAGLVNLDRDQGVRKANYDCLYDLQVENGIRIHYCRNVNATETVEWIGRQSPDLIIQSGWSQKFREPLLSLPRLGCLGEHPAPLPRGRGAACVNWAILNGETDWGDSFFRMVQEYDAGPVYAQRRFRIESYDTCKTIYDRVAVSSAEMVAVHLSSWCEGEFMALTLDESQASYYKQRRPQDGEIEFSWPLQKLQNYVRALTRPYPGAFFVWQDTAVVVWSAEITAEHTDTRPGEFLGTDQEGGCYVSVGDNGVWCLRRVQEVGEQETWGADFYHRHMLEGHAAAASRRIAQAQQP